MNQMKSFLRHLKKNPLYAGGFSNRADVFSNFQKEDDPKIQIVYANYVNEDYSGVATVFYYRRDTRKYYETYASHCSCYRLEGQWNSDEILVPEEMEKRLSNGQLGDGDIFKQAFESFKEGR